MTTTEDVPDAAALREVREILRTFERSGWTGMTLELRGLRVTTGKTGPPPAAPARAPSTPPAPSAGAAAPPVPSAGPAAPPVASAGPSAAPPAPPPSAVPEGAVPGGVVAAGDVGPEGLVEVRSPAVGTFWLAPSPGQPPFVQVGQTVAQDDQLAIVEVMKLMNPVFATIPGTVVEIRARTAEMVEYDEVLFRIRPVGP